MRRKGSLNKENFRKINTFFFFCRTPLLICILHDGFQNSFDCRMLYFQELLVELVYCRACLKLLITPFRDLQWCLKGQCSVGCHPSLAQFKVLSDWYLHGEAHGLAHFLRAHFLSWSSSIVLPLQRIWFLKFCFRCCGGLAFTGKTTEKSWICTFVLNIDA